LSPHIIGPAKTQAERVIAKFGGVKLLHEALMRTDPANCPSVSRIYRWVQEAPTAHNLKAQCTGGLSPTRAMSLVLKAARLEGVFLSFEDLYPGILGDVEGKGTPQPLKRGRKSKAEKEALLNHDPRKEHRINPRYAETVGEPTFVKGYDEDELKALELAKEFKEFKGQAVPQDFALERERYTTAEGKKQTWKQEVEMRKQKRDAARKEALAKKAQTKANKSEAMKRVWASKRAAEKNTNESENTK